VEVIRPAKSPALVAVVFHIPPDTKRVWTIGRRTRPEMLCLLTADIAPNAEYAISWSSLCYPFEPITLSFKLTAKR
jgi:hypothetical protein